MHIVFYLHFIGGLMDIFISIMVIVFICWILVGNTKEKKSNYQRGADSSSQPESHFSLVNRSNYQIQKLMSPPEFVIFRTLQKALGKDFYIFPQVALGEVLTSVYGHSAINAKRVDLLIVNKQGYAVAAVEFNGKGSNGHYQGNAAERDAVKYIALTNAGVKYIAVSTTDEEVLRSELEMAGFILQPLRSYKRA